MSRKRIKRCSSHEPASQLWSSMASCRNTPPPSHYAPEVTESDRFWFAICRTAVGVFVLGLTLSNFIFCAAPLFAETIWPVPPAPPPPPPGPAPPFELFTDEDAHATRMIMYISAGQATLMATIAAYCWLRKRGQPATLARKSSGKSSIGRKRAKKPGSTHAAHTKPPREQIGEMPAAPEDLPQQEHRHLGVAGDGHALAAEDAHAAAVPLIAEKVD